MKLDDTYKLIAIVIAGVSAVVVFIVFSCYMNKRKKLQLQEQPPTPQPLREIVSAPTYQPRNIDVVNDLTSNVLHEDGLRGKSDTIVKKSIAPLRPYSTVDDSSRSQAAPKRMERVRGKRDGGIVVMTGASTSAFGGGCGGGSGCGGSHSGGDGCDGGGGGGGCGGGGGGGGCGGC